MTLPTSMAFKGVSPTLIEVHGCICNIISVRVAIDPASEVANPTLYRLLIVRVIRCFINLSKILHNIFPDCQLFKKWF